MTKQVKKPQKLAYIKLHDGLAIRKVPQSKNWGLYLKLKGQKPLQISLKTADENEARVKAMKEYTYALALLENGESIRQPKQRLSVRQVLDEIIVEHEKAQETTKQKGRDGSHATHIRIWKRIKDFYDPEIKPFSLDISKVRDYMKNEEPYSDTQLTATRYCFTFLFDRCLEKKLISNDNIFSLNKIKVEKIETKRRDHFTFGEFSSLYVYALYDASLGNKKTKHSREMAVAYICFIFYSGIRVGFEALGIRWSDLDYNQNGDLFGIIRDGKTKNYKKNRRYVLLDFYAEESVIQAARVKYNGQFDNYTNKAIISHLSKTSPNEQVFSTLYSKNPTYPDMFKRWVDTIKSAGEVSDNKILTLYSLRHSYITRAIENDTQLSLIAENAGTSVTIIEKHYSHVSVMSLSARKALMRDKIALFEKNSHNQQNKTPEEIQTEKNELIELVEKTSPL
jgi:integrase